jgi:hypothetical protein
MTPFPLTPAALMLDAARRALADLFQPRIVLISLLPLLLAALALALMAWWGWDSGVQVLRVWMDDSGWVRTASETSRGWGLAWLPALAAPLLLALIAVPPVLLVSLLLMASLTTPLIANQVRRKRFPDLGTAPPVSMWRALWWSMGSAWQAVGMFIVTLPLLLIPPLGIVLPSAIGGWLTYRVMAFDILSGIATTDERHALVKQHRLPLLLMGMASGYLSAMPAALWMFGLFWNMVIGPVLLLCSMWAYMLVFCFMSLWFSHFLLAALQARRGPAPYTLETP